MIIIFGCMMFWFWEHACSDELKLEIICIMYSYGLFYWA